MRTSKIGVSGKHLEFYFIVRGSGEGGMAGGGLCERGMRRGREGWQATAYSEAVANAVVQTY